MEIESTTIREFIETFERLFGSYLQPCEEDPCDTKYFKIIPAKKKYSDWDLKCFLLDHVEFEQVEQMVRFVESYPAFDDIGHFMTDAEEYAERGTHTSNGKLIQIMAFIKNEPFAPFFDLSIRKVKNSYVKRLFHKSYNEEFVSWAMLTAWRKVKNDHYGENGFLPVTVVYLMPHFTDDNDRRDILLKPQEFFASKLGSGKYKNAVAFLQDSLPPPPAPST